MATLSFRSDCDFDLLLEDLADWFDEKGYYANIDKDDFYLLAEKSSILRRLTGTVRRFELTIHGDESDFDVQIKTGGWILNAIFPFVLLAIGTTVGFLVSFPWLGLILLVPLLILYGWPKMAEQEVKLFVNRMVRFPEKAGRDRGPRDEDGLDDEDFDEDYDDEEDYDDDEPPEPKFVKEKKKSKRRDYTADFPFEEHVRFENLEAQKRRLEDQLSRGQITDDQFRERASELAKQHFSAQLIQQLDQDLASGKISRDQYEIRKADGLRKIWNTEI